MTDGVLGVWDGHDAGVALVADGVLVFALSEERPSRRKRASGWPGLALARCLAWASDHGVRVRDVALAGRYGRSPLRWLDPIYRARDPRGDPLSPANRVVAAFENRVPGVAWLRGVEAAAGLWPVKARLGRVVGPGVRVRVVDHHEAHAFCALFGPRDGRGLVVTWDAYGEGRAVTVRPAEAPERARAWLGPEAGVASLYGAVTVALGFGEGDEGKVMGLAALGDPARGEDRLRSAFDVGPDGAPRLRRPLSRGVVRRLLRGLGREDAAAGLQAATERLVLGWLAPRVEEARADRLLLAGGLFANVRLNLAVAGLPGAGGVFVFPAMGDGGLPAGAAHRVWWERHGRLGEPLRDVALGLEYSAEECEAAARAAGLATRRSADAPAEAAREVVAGRVVAWFDGRDEFGPRALGRRSILFRADRVDLADRVNRALGRDDFMPFGPALAEEDAREAWSGSWRDEDLRYMTLAVPASESFRARCAAAVHVDGTCRPQVATADVVPRFHRLLREVRRLGGPPAVVNTSFNLHGEPIVHDPVDAVATFQRAGLDVLFLGDVAARGSAG